MEETRNARVRLRSARIQERLRGLIDKISSAFDGFAVRTKRRSIRERESIHECDLKGGKNKKMEVGHSLSQSGVEDRREVEGFLDLLLWILFVLFPP